jgi:hypothetical protein
MATVRLQLRRGTEAQWVSANPTLAAGEIGIEIDTNTFKFGDGSTAWNSLSYALSQTVDDYILLNTKGVANGVASLDSSGFIPTTQLPPLAKVTVSAVANQAARTALTAEPGDIAIQSDNGTTYVLASSPASTNANWREISATAAISAAIATHEADTTSVHGIADTGILVTTTGTQTLTNKTITTPSGLVKSDVGLGNVDNTSDLAKPVSTATLSALGVKAPLNSPALTGDATAVNLTLSGNLTVNGTTSTINSTTLTVQDKDIVLGQTSSPTDAAADQGGIVLKGTTDKSMRYSLAKSAWDFSENINLPGDKAVKINNIDVLTVSTVLGKGLPGVVVGTTETQTLTNKTLTSPTMSDPVISGTVALPLTTSVGNVTQSQLQALSGVTSSVQDQISARAPLASPTFTGTVSGVTKAMVGLADADNTSDAAKPVSTATQSALDLKAPLASPTFTGTVGLPATTSIGLASAEEIATLNGAASNIQAQIDLKAPLASPTFTGTVSGITKAMVGLTNASDTSDLAKPISTATQSALDLKAPLASPTFSGTVSLPSTTSIGLVSAIELELLNGASSNIQDQIDLKAPLASPTFTGTVTLPAGTVTSGMIADGAVATADIADLAISTAKIADSAITEGKIANDAVTTGKIAANTIVNADISLTAEIATSKISGLDTALGLKAPLASPTFTGTVSGITKTMVGLGSVDNTADSAKPVSTATQTALDLKAPLASPTFTGTVTTGHILPATNLASDLGSPAKMWRDIYVGPGSLYVNGQKVLQTDAGDVVVTADVNENLALRTSGDGNIELDPTGSGSVTIKAPLVIQAGNNISNSDGNAVNFGGAIKTDTISSKTANTDLSLSADGTGKVYLNDNAEVNGNLVVGGNLTVSGTTTTVNSETISLADNIIDLNSNFTSGTPTENSGIKIKRGDSADVQMRWNESTDKWDFTNDGTNYSSVAGLESPTFTGTVSGVTKSMVGLGSVDNTADSAKPVSTATQTALDLKLASATAATTYAPLASPTFTGTVTVAAAGVAFTDGTQTKAGVPSLTTIGTEIAADYNLSTVGLTLRDQLIPVAGTRAITVPANATTAFPIGTSVDFYQASGTGANFVEAVGVTILRTPGLKLRTTYSSATLTKVAINTWLLAGDLTA